jgi:hypothetical protein
VSRAAQLDVVRRWKAAQCEGSLVVELHVARFLAATPAHVHVTAAPRVASPHFAPHRGRNDSATLPTTRGSDLGRGHRITRVGALCKSFGTYRQILRGMLAQPDPVSADARRSGRNRVRLKLVVWRHERTPPPATEHSTWNTHVAGNLAGGRSPVRLKLVVWRRQHSTWNVGRITDAAVPRIRRGNEQWNPSTPRSSVGTNP